MRKFIAISVGVVVAVLRLAHFDTVQAAAFESGGDQRAVFAQRIASLSEQAKAGGKQTFTDAQALAREIRDAGLANDFSEPLAALLATTAGSYRVAAVKAIGPALHQCGIAAYAEHQVGGTLFYRVDRGNRPVLVRGFACATTSAGIDVVTLHLAGITQVIFDMPRDQVRIDN